MPPPPVAEIVVPAQLIGGRSGAGRTLNELRSANKDVKLTSQLELSSLEKPHQIPWNVSLQLDEPDSNLGAW